VAGKTSSAGETVGKRENPMTKIMYTKAFVRRATLAAAIAGALIVTPLAATLNFDEAVDHNTLSIVAGGGMWGG
jgi:hypothetical protein